MARYFGTDGIRGPFGGSLVNLDFVRRFGHGLAAFLRQDFPNKPLTVALGRDTRASGVDLQGALSEGLCANHINVVHLGVIPTPGVAQSVQQLHADLGIALTASHNPASDNGIKLFDNRGHKLLPETEARIEDCIESQPEHPAPADTCGFEHDGRDHYTNYMRSLLHQNCLAGWKVVLDCANGATYRTSPFVMKHYGCDLKVIGAEPNGSNINDGVGSESPEKLAAAVKESGAQLGIAHDGDGDRCVLCDETGSIVDGDRVLGLLALHHLRRGTLKDETLVATIQSNTGLDRCLERYGGRVIRTEVGDRNVLHELIRGGYSLGGESSGHIIFPEFLEAGDGLMAAIKTIEVMLATGLPLSTLAAQIPLFPQRTQSIRVPAKRPLEECPSIREAVAKAEERLGDRGRVLVRYSGTEPKLRLLVESESVDWIEPLMSSLSSAVTSDLC